MKVTRLNHDSFFRRSMSNPKVATEFFEQHLPAELIERVNLDTLELRNSTYIDKKLKNSISDIVYSVDISDKAGYFYLLIEHQSSVDRLMPFRLLQYCVSLMDNHVRGSKSKTLPIVYPMLYYNGKRPYSGTMDLFELFGKEMSLARRVLVGPYHLIDLHNISDADLRKKTHAGIMQIVMKHAFERDLLGYLRSVKRQLASLLDADEKDYVQSIITYILSTGSVDSYDEILENILKGNPDELGEQTMTIADYLEARGLEKGLEKGREEEKLQIAQNLLHSGAETGLVQRVTELDDAAMQRLVREQTAAQV